MNKSSLSIYLAGVFALGLCLNVSAMRSLNSNEISFTRLSNDDISYEEQHIDGTTNPELLSLVDQIVDSTKTSPQIEQPNDEKKQLPFPEIIAATPELTPIESDFREAIIFHDDKELTKLALQKRKGLKKPFDIEKKSDEAVLLEAIREGRSTNVNLLVKFYLNDAEPLQCAGAFGELFFGRTFLKDGKYYWNQKTFAERKQILLNKAYEWLSDMVDVDNQGVAVRIQDEKIEAKQILRFLQKTLLDINSQVKALKYINEHYTFEKK